MKYPNFAMGPVEACVDIGGVVLGTFSPGLVSLDSAGDTGRRNQKRTSFMGHPMADTAKATVLVVDEELLVRMDLSRQLELRRHMGPTLS